MKHNIAIVKIKTGNANYPVAHEVKIDGRALEAPVDLSRAIAIKERLENDEVFLTQSIEQIEKFESLQAARAKLSGSAYSELLNDVRIARKTKSHKNLIDAANEVINERGLRDVVSAQQVAWDASGYR